MSILLPGQTAEMQGSGKKPYILRNIGGIFDCSCPAWRNVGGPIDKRTCKHLRKYLGDEHENTRTNTDIITKESKVAVEAPPLLLAHVWDNEEDITGWWMSEKLDGLRVYWNKKELLSRLGNKYYAPDWFIEQLPDLELDGELWIKRGDFQHTSSVVRCQDKGEGWREVKFKVFDALKVEGKFEDRIEALKKAIPKNHPFLSLLPQKKCKGIEHLREELKKVEAMGGEGLMLRQPNSNYESGRSNTLLKVKSFLDAEALVIGHEAGKGKHKGRLGALRCKFKDVEFKVGTGLSDKERENPPSIGSTITFRYQELSTYGVPRFPSYIRIYNT